MSVAPSFISTVGTVPTVTSDLRVRISRIEDRQIRDAIKVVLQDLPQNPCSLIGPIAVQFDGKTQFAFATQLSVDGLRLVHAAPLPLGEVLLTIPARRRPLVFRAELVATESVGDGWHTTSGAIVEVVETDRSARR